MNLKVLHKEVQQFIFDKSNTSIDLSALILKGSPFEDITSQELAQQISGRLKAKEKLPTWSSKSGIYYPPTLNLEQTSSEKTAYYKSKLVSGDTLIDLTGGFGIDDYFFSQQMKHVIHCELNPELSHISHHNFSVLEAINITSSVGDGLETLSTLDTVDWIYIDPSRRHEHKGKVFFLEDCIPNVPVNLTFLFSKTKNIAIKTSPLLDINSGLKSLQFVKEIHVIAVNNEVKELLWILDSTFDGDCTMITKNIKKTGEEEFIFLLKDEPQQLLSLGDPETYLYEPNAAILKSGGFLSIASAFGLKKLHQHSHLYTADHKIDFPGRYFKIESIHPYQKKILAKLGIQKANITTRNFPESVTQIRKKLKIKDGGENYLFFTTDMNNKKIVIHCKK